MTRTAAFFDLDRTLIDVNSGVLWAQYERRQGNISSWMMARVAFWNVMYHLSFIDMEMMFARAVGHYRGVPRHELDRRTREWFESDIRQRLRREAKDIIAEHHTAGHILVLLTSSSCFEAAAASEAFGIEHWLANDFCTDGEGLLTGDFVRPLCYGPGKVERAEAFARERDIDLERSFYYADSYSDRFMLERVGEARVVSPDPRLRRAAGKRNWPILPWTAAPQVEA